MSAGVIWVRCKEAALDEAHIQLREGRVTLRALVGMLLGAFSIVRRAGHVIVLTAVAAALLCAVGWLGVVGAVFVIGAGLTAAVGNAAHDYRRMATVGAMVLAVAAPCAGAIRVGANLAQQHGEAHFVSGWALFFGVTLVGTFMLLPLLEAAARTAHGSTVGAAIAASLVATGRRGLLVTLLFAAVATAAIAIVPVLDTLVPLELLPPRSDGPEFSAALTMFAAGGAITLTVWTLMAATLAAEQPAERVRSRSAFALVVSAMALLTLATLAGATLVPAPLQPTTPDAPLAAPLPPGNVSAVVDERVAEAPLLFVFDGVIRRETIPLSPGDRLFDVFVTPDETIAVVIARRDETLARACFDAHGHRIDDGPLDRIASHLGVAATAALLGCAALLFYAMFRTQRRARLHRAVRRGRETLLRGHLRGLDLPPLQAADGIAQTRGWSFEATDGTAWLALPHQMPLLGAPRAMLAEGAPIELVAPEPIDRLHFRGGRAAAPDGAALVIPDAGAIEWLVGTWALGPAGGALGAASLFALAGMVLTLGAAADVGPLVTSGIDSLAARMETAAPAGDPLPLTDPTRAERIAANVHYLGITYVSGTRTDISSALRDEIARMETLPDVRLEGNQLLDIAPGSLLDLLGFQSGDVIVSIAGVPIDTPSMLHVLGPTVRVMSIVGIRVRRRGYELDLVFRVVP